MFTFIANNVEDDAKAYATSKFEATQPKERNEAEAKYLDSIETIPNFWELIINRKRKRTQQRTGPKGGSMWSFRFPWRTS